MSKPQIDERLKEWATPRQAEYIDAIIKFGSIRKAAAQLGLAKQTIDHGIAMVKARAARGGHAPGHFDAGVAPGYRMGKVTVQRSASGVERVWERQHPEREKLREELIEFVANVVDDVRGMSPLVDLPDYPSEDLLSMYCFGDPHFGLASSKLNGGEDTELEEADRLTRAGIDSLVNRMPSTEKAVLLFAGDNTHANDSTAQTPKGKHQLEVDVKGHGQSVLSVSRAICYASVRALENHDFVEVWVLPGNHDPDAAFAVAVAVSMFFENNDRVRVRLSQDYLWHLQFGKNLIAACHGDKVKPIELHGILSNDCKDFWHLCDFRYVWFGHVHHDTVLEFQKTRMESLRTLSKTDRWHKSHGFRSMRDTRAVLYHADHGEISRVTVNASLLGG